MVERSRQEGAIIYTLLPAVQEYAWGVRGRESLVARLSARDIDEKKHYAELWMGTHPRAPSMILHKDGTTEPLLNKVSPRRLAGGGEERDLPFLFKVLSVQKALSIQAHPDAALAKRLHGEDPANYPDANHKPEMAIALSPTFEALLGFRSLSQIAGFVGAIPELAALLPCDALAVLQEAVSAAAAQGGGQPSEAERGALRYAFGHLMSAPSDAVAREIDCLLDRLSREEGGGGVVSQEGAICRRLAAQFPGDVGCFCVFFLNHVTLCEGEAIFLAANEPHAYLSGDCIECMALSDNVVRAALTPKFRDVRTLLEMLTYTPILPGSLLMAPAPLAHKGASASRPRSVRYAGPASEFAVIRIGLSAEGECEAILCEANDVIALCLSGTGRVTVSAEGASREGTAVSAGSVLFLKRTSSAVSVECTSPEGLLLFVASANST